MHALQSKNDKVLASNQRLDFHVWKEKILLIHHTFLDYVYKTF